MQRIRHPTTTTHNLTHKNSRSLKDRYSCRAFWVIPRAWVDWHAVGEILAEGACQLMGTGGQPEKNTTPTAPASHNSVADQPTMVQSPVSGPAQPGDAQPTEAMSGVPVPRPNRRARRFPLPITTSSIRSGTFLRSRSPRTCTTPAVPVLHPVRGHPSQPR